MLMQLKSLGCSCLKMKRIIILQRSNRLVVPQLVLVVRFVILCQVVRMFIRRCVLRVLAILRRQSQIRTGKGLPQQVISKGAAHGYSSYGNQIGLATTYVKEYFHPGFVAKRLETGAVVGAAPKENVLRLKPEAGDAIVIFGGKTGRDGVGGATGSSKVQTKETVETAGAEVQKGNAIEERKIQRLFRNPKVTQLVKKSNDFGAGGVCVAIGELADGVKIDLDKSAFKISKGLSGTEIAISESQERMSVVVSAQDVAQFIAECEKKISWPFKLQR